MSIGIYERAISKVLEYYLAIDEELLQKHLLFPDLVPKERVTTINDLQIKIFPNDHAPPHFHVVSKNKEINAKFTIQACELISGTISAKNLKRIRAFAESMKGKLLLEKVWNKYHGT